MTATATVVLDERRPCSDWVLRELSQTPKEPQQRRNKNVVTGPGMMMQDS